MKRKYIIPILASAVLTISSCKKEIPDETAGEIMLETPAPVNQTVGAFVPNEILLKFNPNTSAESKAFVFDKMKAVVSEYIYTKAMESQGEKEGIYLLQIPGDVMETVNTVGYSEVIQYAEPNYIYNHHASSNDTYFTNGSLWGMYGDASSPANQYGSQAAEAWATGHTGSSSVIVGIIDEGFMNSHEDLSANSWVNPYETVNGIDDDGNGYKDDTRGWDFAGNNNSTYDGYADDHGTHVAGTIGGMGGNSKGVAGVNWSVKMISGKFLGNNGGTTANAVKAVDYFTDLKTRHGLNICATNNSWGGGGYSQSLYDAINRANNANILFCAAAGNNSSNNNNVANYPSNYSNPNIIAVASITSSGALSSFSNYGATQVDIGAPGSSIYSTLPTRKNASTYGSYSGTSMATPHVTGAAALYAASNSGYTAASIKAAIMGSAVSTSSLSGKCLSGGRLNCSGF